MQLSKNEIRNLLKDYKSNKVALKICEIEKRYLNSIRSLTNIEKINSRKTDYENKINLTDKIISLLSENEKHIISLKYFEDKKAKEIAAIKNIKSNSINVYCYRIIKKIEKEFQ